MENRVKLLEKIALEYTQGIIMLDQKVRITHEQTQKLIHLVQKQNKSIERLSQLIEFSKK